MTADVDLSVLDGLSDDPRTARQVHCRAAFFTQEYVQQQLELAVQRGLATRKTVAVYAVTAAGRRALSEEKT